MVKQMGKKTETKLISHKGILIRSNLHQDVVIISCVIMSSVITLPLVSEQH